MEDREYIFESSSPICHIDALIAQERNAYYLYFFCSPEYGAKVLNKLWICNRHGTPPEMDLRCLDRGEGPVLGRENVSELQPKEGMTLDPDKLSCVWFDTGDACAIYHDNKLICVIPPIAGLYDFPGFSVFAKGQTRYAWGMPEGPDLENRIKTCKSFWEIIPGEETWQKLEQDYLAITDSFFGAPHTSAKPIGTERFPHRTLVQGRKANMVFNITIGVSQYAMPGAAQAFGNNCADQSRIELAFATIDKHEAILELMGMVMKDAGDMPWDERSFLWHGHTFDFPNIRGFAAMLFINPIYVEGLEEPKWRSFAGGRVNTLWMVPINEAELSFLRQHGIEELIKQCPAPKLMHIFSGMPQFLPHTFSPNFTRIN
jgi:hypothetical protein